MLSRHIPPSPTPARAMEVPADAVRCLVWVFQDRTLAGAAGGGFFQAFVLSASVCMVAKLGFARTVIAMLLGKLCMFGQISTSGDFRSPCHHAMFTISIGPKSVSAATVLVPCLFNLFDSPSVVHRGLKQAFCTQTAGPRRRHFSFLFLFQCCLCRSPLGPRFWLLAGPRPSTSVRFLGGGGDGG